MLCFRFLLSFHLCLIVYGQTSWFSYYLIKAQGFLLCPDSPRVCPVCPVPSDDCETYSETTKLYERTVTFSLSNEELLELEKSDNHYNAGEILDILIKILENNKTSNLKCNKDEDRSNIYKDTLQLVQTIEPGFTFLLTAVLALIWFLSRYYNVNFFWLTLVTFFAIGYLVTYYDCNRNMETEEYVKFLKSEPDPERTTLSDTFFWFLPFKWFQQTSKEKIINNFRETRKIKLPFCRPEEVLFIYFNGMLVNQLKLFIDECCKVMRDFEGNLSFPLSFLAIFMFVVLAPKVIKLVFKFILSPRAWAKSPNLNSKSNQQDTRNATIYPVATSEDRLSGENLKLVLERLPLSNGAKPSCQHNNVSGVEEITTDADNDCFLDANTNLNQSTDKMTKDERSVAAENADIIIDGVPTSKDENITNFINHLCDSIDCRRPKKAFRTNPKKSNSPIIVKFYSQSDRIMLMKAAARFRKKVGGTLKLSNVGIESDSPFYINECLSSDTLALLKEARKLKQRKQLFAAFSENNKIFVRITETGKPILIDNLDALYSLMESEEAAL